MSIRAIKVHGRKVWQARVAYRGQRMSTIRDSKAEAKTAEAQLLGKLQAKAGQADQQGTAPATVRGLLETYAEGLKVRGKGDDTIGRAASTALAVERLTPTLLDKAVGAVTDADVRVPAGAGSGEHQTVHDQPRYADPPRRAQGSATRLSFSGCRLLP